MKRGPQTTILAAMRSFRRHAASLCLRIAPIADVEDVQMETIWKRHPIRRTNKKAHACARASWRGIEFD